MKFINIHAHSKTATAAVLLSVHENFQSLDPNSFYSIGLHPWYIKESDGSRDFKMLKLAATNSNVLAIGECGLDRVCDTDFELQKQYFIKQIELANEIQKPMIIHCVRAFEEVLHLLKQHHVSVSVIFHGFNKNTQLASRLVKAGHYLSFGKQLKNESIQDVLRSVPINRVFLETDDSNLSIDEVYVIAAQALSMSQAELASQIEANVHSVFGKAFNYE